MSFDDFKKKEIKNLINFGIKNSSEYEDFNNLTFSLKKMGMYNKEMLKKAWEIAKKEDLKLKTNVDCYDVIYRVAANSNIKKIAYPNNSADKVIGMYGKEFNLKNWSQIVKIIYNKFFESGESANFQAIVEDQTNELIRDPEERFKFKQWLRYYNEGNDKKYSNKKENSMKKTSSFYLPLTTDAYSSDSNPYASGTDMSSFKKSVNEAQDNVERKTSYKDWKKKFNTAWRRIDKILKESEDYIEPEKYEEISEVMHKLDVQIGKIRFKSTASDMSFVASESSKKIGFREGADILKKFAQETAAPITENEEVAQTTADPQAQATQEQTKTPEEVSAERRAENKNNEIMGEEALKNIAPLPGPSVNEYDKLIAPNVSVDDASKKLEQIAGMLSDRRVIRYLAEFDIMLDKLGIASMFPELAEAQSKLIDSYSYGLVRVTKMLGMLSNNKAIFDRGAGESSQNVGEQSESTETQPQQQVPAEQPPQQ